MVDTKKNYFFTPDAHYTRINSREDPRGLNITEDYSYVFARNEDECYIFIKHKIWDNGGNIRKYNHVFKASEEAYNELLEGHMNYTRNNRGRCNVKKGHTYTYFASCRYHAPGYDDGYGMQDTVRESWIYHDVIEQLTFMQIGDLINMDIDMPIEDLDFSTRGYKALTTAHMAQFRQPLPPVPPYTDWTTYPLVSNSIPDYVEYEEFPLNRFPSNDKSRCHTMIDMSRSLEP